MKPDARQHIHHLEEFLSRDSDLTLSEVKAELRAQGVNVDAFAERIRRVAQGHADSNSPLPKMSSGEISEMFTQILSGGFEPEFREAAIAHVETTGEELNDADPQARQAARSPEKQQTGQSAEDVAENYQNYPLSAMIERGWISGSAESVRAFFDQLPSVVRRPVFCRKTEYMRSRRKMDSYALTAWTIRVVSQAHKAERIATYKKGGMTRDFMRELVRQSRGDHGPSAARELLREIGIALVIEPHLPRTYLDGAAILVLEELPIIGLTIRHDRLDNFWFTLMHELAHLHLHSELGKIEFFDDLDELATKDPREKEADQLAGEMLIPEAAWRASPASRSRMPQAVELLAAQLQIHPAIVAGRARHASKSFQLFKQFVGHHAVRSEFAGVTWPT